MQKSRQGATPPRDRKARKGASDAQSTSSNQVGTPDWALEQQQSAGNQTVLGMIGGTRENAEIAAGRPIGRMAEWTPRRGGEMKCNCVFPPGTKVNVGDVGTIADRWGFRVERWEVINDNVHIEFVTMAPQDQFAWGNEVILGAAPAETVLEEVQKDEAEGKSLLGAASGLLAAGLLAPPGQQVPGAAAPGMATAQPAMGLPGMSPQAAAPAAAGSTGLAASMVAMAMGTPTQATPGAAPGVAVPGVGPAAPTAATTTKASLLEAAMGTSVSQPATSPDQQLQQNAQAFAKALNNASPDMSALQRIATSVQGSRLFELLGRDLSARQIENLVRTGQGSSSGQGLIALLGERLYPQLNGSAQSAWDAVVDEELVEQTAKSAPAASDGPVKAQA